MTAVYKADANVVYHDGLWLVLQTEGREQPYAVWHKKRIFWFSASRADCIWFIENHKLIATERMEEAS